MTAAAYTNNVAAATSTLLYNINSNTDMFYRQGSPNTGTLVVVGALGLNTTAVNGFDIGSTTPQAYYTVLKTEPALVSKEQVLFTNQGRFSFNKTDKKSPQRLHGR